MSIIPTDDVCVARRNDGTRCIRKKKNGLFCGVHCKKFPAAGIFVAAAADGEPETHILRVGVYIKEVRGIPYYFDDNGNVYHTKDVLENKQDPRIVGRWEAAAAAGGYRVHLKNGEIVE